jgi:hypothetical protein
LDYVDEVGLMANSEILDELALVGEVLQQNEIVHAALAPLV